jgi:hypothetical protein
MEEVIGSIPIRSTKITSAESKSYSRHLEERNQKQGRKKGTLRKYGNLRRTQNQKAHRG